MLQPTDVRSILACWAVTASRPNIRPRLASLVENILAPLFVQHDHGHLQQTPERLVHAVGDIALDEDIFVLHFRGAAHNFCPDGGSVARDEELETRFL